MAEKIFTLASFHSKKDLGLILDDYTRPILAEATEQIVDIPGMRGVVYEGMNVGQKTFTLDVTLLCKSERDRVLKLRDLSNFFYQMMDGDEYPLIFGDEEDVIWWVHPTDISEPQRLSRTGHDVEFTITLKSSSGVGEGLTHEIELTSQTTKITPKGNTTTYPVLTFIGKEQTKVGVSDGNRYVYLGRGFDVENQDAPINQRPRVLNDPCTTLATWTKLSSTNSTFNIENGVISNDADIRSTGKALAVTQKNGKDFYGANVSKKWHGPARQQWLPKALSNWKVDARFYTNNKYPRARFKVELYLLDATGRRIGKMMIKDGDDSLENSVHAQIGYDSNGTRTHVYSSGSDDTVTSKKAKTTTKTIKYKEKVKTTKVSKKGKKTTTTKTVTKTASLGQDNTTNSLTDFYGNITLEKNGNKYTATVQTLDSKGNKKGKLRTDTYTDTKNVYGDKLAAIAIYFARYDIEEDSKSVEYAATTLQLSDVKVWEILGETNQLVVEENDELIINCSNQTVTKNGSSFTENVYVGSDFFEMDSGVATAFAVSPPPDENNKWYLTYTERFN